MNLKSIFVQPEELEGLPQELLDQLRSNVDNPVQKAIMQAIGDDVTSIDQILVRVYHSTKKVHTRNSIIGHLYRLKRAKKIAAENGAYRRC